MSRSVLIAGLLFFSAPWPVHAQQLIFKSYTEEDGLVSNPVRCIFQDSRGFIWIGTWQGLSKYDGHKFTNYTTVNGLSDNMINDIYESSDGKLFIAENGGMVDLLQHDAISKKAVFNNILINRFLVTKDKRVIVGTDTGGLHIIKNRNLLKPQQKLPHTSYSDLIELNDSLFIGGGEGPLYILNKEFDILSEIKQPKDVLIVKIYKDSEKRIWVSTNSGLKTLSPFRNNKQLSNLSLQNPPFKIPVLENSRVNDMLEDANGDFWMATTKGLLKIDITGSWQLFVEKDGLPSSDIRCIYRDKENNMWIGTSFGLAKLVTKSNIRIFTNEHGLSANGVGLIATAGKEGLLIGTNRGYQLYNNNTGKNHFITIYSDNIIYGGLVENSRPYLFYGNNNRFGKYDSVHQRIVDYTLPGNLKSEMYCSVMDANGIIFCGTQKGLLIHTGRKSYYETKLSHRLTFLLIDKNGYLWAGTWNNGLFRIQYSNADNRIEIAVKDFSDLIPDKNIRCLFEDSKGNIWAGTRHLGIVKLSYNNTGRYAVQLFDLRQGLISNWIRAIAEDEKGCIWIGSYLGIDKLVPVGTTFRVFNFSRVNNYFDNINNIVPGQNNAIWLASDKGLIHIIDGEMEKTPAGKIFITSVRLGDTSFNYNRVNNSSITELKYHKNQAAFEFSSPAFINEKQILYSYRLLGSADTTWSKPANLQNVSYASLQPGSYRFEVRTTGWNGEWGPIENFSFLVLQPYWQTWWFYSLVCLAAIFIFYVLYRYRIKQLLKLQKVRNRIASDLHDDIGATLTNINILSEISRKNLEQPKEAEKFLQRITEEVTFTTQALNDIIWSVNSRNDSIEEMLTRMRRYAAELFDNSNTICHLSLDQTIADKKLNMEQRRDLYLMYKEIMNNIHKHASAANIWINVHIQNGQLYMNIKDDGKGFDFSGATTGNGLKNIRSRSEKWKGVASVKTSAGNGTQIEIMIPLVN